MASVIKLQTSWYIHNTLRSMLLSMGSGVGAMIDPQALFNKAMESADEWADKDHASGVLEDALSTLEGTLIAELKAKGEPITIIPKLIKTDTRWKESAQAWRKAKKEALIARLKYDQVNRFMDNIRTKESTERALAR